MAQDKAGRCVSLIPKFSVCFRIICTFYVYQQPSWFIFLIFVFETNIYHVLRGSKINFKLDVFTFNKGQGVFTDNVAHTLSLTQQFMTVERDILCIPCFHEISVFKTIRSSRNSLKETISERFVVYKLRLRPRLKSAKLFVFPAMNAGLVLGPNLPDT